MVTFFLLNFLFSTLLSMSEVSTSKIHWYPLARFLISCSNLKLQSHTMTTHPFTVSKRFWLFSICRPRSFLSKRVKNLSSQPEKTNPPVLTTWLFSANQNPIIIQACNRRDHEDFQLTDIFHFTSWCSHDYTCFFHNYRCSNFLLS